jgi:hypothetical protein
MIDKFKAEREIANPIVKAPDSEDDFVRLLLSGHSVYLESGSGVVPIKLIESLKVRIAKSEGAFESNASLACRAVMARDAAHNWSAEFSGPIERTGLIFWIESEDPHQ